MSKVDLNLYTTATKDGDQYKIGDIPPKLWTQFVDRAKILMPEAGDDAWSAFLCNAIASVCDGNSYTFIMTDIPATAKAAMNEACEGAKCRDDQVVGQLYKSAMQGKLHLVNISDIEQSDNTHTIVVVGLPDRAWDGWDGVAEKANIETEYLLGMMLEAAANNQLQFTANPEKRPEGIPTRKGNNGNGSNQQRQQQGMGERNRVASFGTQPRQPDNRVGRTGIPTPTIKRQS